MEELAKVRRVIEGKLEGAPHETLLVVDATTGQNGLQQARLFGEAVGVTGVALTKLDGSAKGGIAVAIALRARPAGQADRRRRDARGSTAVRPGRLRARAALPSYASTANAMFTVVRYSLMRSFSTSALIETTTRP